MDDATYELTYVNIGCNGRGSDDDIFNICSLCAASENNTINLPPPRQVGGRDNLSPFVFVAGNTFAMKPYLLKPFPFKNQPRPNRVFH